MHGDSQLNHAEHKRSYRKFPLSIIADSIISPRNIGSLFRLCDALGIERLYLCGDSATPPNSKINKTARSTEKHVDYVQCNETTTLVRQLKESGSFIIALEITSKSIDIGSPELQALIKPQTPICLILGSENSGVSEALLSLSDVSVHIPMHGNNSSMNVISAASIACFEIIRLQALSPENSSEDKFKADAQQ